MEILTTLLWLSTIFVTTAVILNYFIIKSDLTNIKKLMSKIRNILMVLTSFLAFILMFLSSSTEMAAALKLNQAILFLIFTAQLILSIAISIKTTPFLSIFANNKEKLKEEENAFLCLIFFLIFSTILFVQYYSL